MEEFVSQNPGAAIAIGSVLGAGLVAFVGLYWNSIRDGSSKTEARLTHAIDKLEETMHEGMDKLTGIIDRMDARHVALTDHIYDRINEVDRRLTQLRGEHDNRGDNCPGSLALKNLLEGGAFDRRRAG